MSRWPLRVQMPVIAVALLLVAEAVLGFAALAILNRTLTDQLDTRLTDAARAVADAPQVESNRPLRDIESELPSDYVLLRHNVAGELVLSLQSGVTPSEVTELDPLVDLAVRVPQTVRIEGTFERWRVLTMDTRPGRGTVTVALPLDDIAAATTSLRRVIWLVVGASAVTGALIAWAVTRRSLRPLREAEITAAAIAAGDLTQRVPEAPPQTEAGSLAESLNWMIERVEDSFAAQAATEEKLRAFVADASHELRTPLAAIQGYAELHRLGTAQDPDDAMARIESNAVRMGGLVQDLLTLARFDAEPASLAGTAEVDALALVRAAAKDLRAQDHTRKVTVEALAKQGEAVVSGSDRHLAQVVANLGANALQHTPAGTPIAMSVARDGDDVVITVRDRGPGISAEDRERIFERFYRIDESRARVTGGSGLGLAIVSAIVSAHGGAVKALEPADGGAAIVVRLPAVG